MKTKILTFFLLVANVVFAQSSAKERILIDEINKVRTDNGLTTLIISDNLNYVAKAHLNDMFRYKPKNNDDYNWYGVGTAYIFKNKEYCRLEMISCKPSELTNFNGGGYEFLLVGEWKSITLEEATSLMRNSNSFNQMLKNKNLKSVGIAIYNNICSIWISTEI